MPAPLKLDRPTLLHTTLPESIRAQLDIHLYSTLEGRVPKGAYQTFFCDRIREYFSLKTLELESGEIIRGSETAIRELKRRLK